MIGEIHCNKLHSGWWLLYGIKLKCLLEYAFIFSPLYKRRKLMQSGGRQIKVLVVSVI